MDETPEQPPERRFDKVDRKLGILWSRIGGTAFLLMGIAMLVSALSGERLLDRWPVLLGSAVVLFLARLCFTSRRSLSDLLDEGRGRG